MPPRKISITGLRYAARMQRTASAARKIRYSASPTRPVQAATDRKSLWAKSIQSVLLHTAWYSA